VSPPLLAGLPSLSSLISDAVGFGANQFLSGLASAVGGAAHWLLDQLGQAMTDTTADGLASGWFQGRFEVMVRLGGTCLGAFLLAAAIQALLRQEPRLLVRALGVQFPLAGLLTFSAVALVRLFETAVDAMCSAVGGGMAGAATGYLGQLATDATSFLSGNGLPVFLSFFLALVAVVGALMLWIELMVRSVAVDAATLFLPLALVAMVWPGAAHVARRLVEVLVALILSKFVIVALLSLGSAAVAAQTGVSSLLMGMGLLLLASLSPFTLLKLLPLVEVGAIAHLEGMPHRNAVGAIRSTWSLANTVAAPLTTSGMSAGIFPAGGGLGGTGPGGPAGDRAARSRAADDSPDLPAIGPEHLYAGPLPNLGLPPGAEGSDGAEDE
jgi:type IV secretion system protein TrbL